MYYNTWRMHLQISTLAEIETLKGNLDPQRAQTQINSIGTHGCPVLRTVRVILYG